jgi:hypothetical protein
MGSVGTAIATILDGNDDDDKEVNDDIDDDYEDDNDDDEIQCVYLVIPPDWGRVECWILDRLFPRPSPIRGTPLLSRRLPSGDDRGSARSVRVCVGLVGKYVLLSRLLMTECSIQYYYVQVRFWFWRLGTVVL